MSSHDSDNQGNSRRGTPWHWKAPGLETDGQAGLLYEPGNWGDLLKDAWVIRIVEACSRADRVAAFRILDPFAGRPCYRLSESARARVAAVTDAGLSERLSHYGARDTFPSSGLLALNVATATGLDARLRVFDGDRERLEQWRSVKNVEVLEAHSGVDALNDHRDADLVLVDPYDLFDHFRAILDACLPLAATRPVLFYLYNKAPRSQGHVEQYGAFRRALARGIASASGAAAALVGRIPSDADLPRASHEVIVAAPAVLLKSLCSELKCVTIGLGAAIPGRGAFEEI